MTAAVIRKAVKEAINGTLLAHRDELEEKIVGKLEDRALIKAIDAGSKSKLVSRAEVKRALRDRQ